MRGLLSPVLFAAWSLAAPQVLPDRSAQAESGTLDGVQVEAIPLRAPVAEIVAAAIPTDGWTVTCDSAQPGNDCSNAIDDSADTFWLTDATASLPQSIVVDMQTSRLVGNITIQPRQDGTSTGNIGQHQVFLRCVRTSLSITSLAAYALVVKTVRTGVALWHWGPTSTTTN